jgi:hypothetical protein
MDLYSPASYVSVLEEKMFHKIIYTGCAFLVLLQGEVARAGHGCPKDHFSIGQLGGVGSGTGKLFANVEEFYTIHDDEPCTKPFASHYPLNLSGSWYVNTEPGSEEIENDPEHELAGTRTIDYNICLKIVDIPDGFVVENMNDPGTYYDVGDCVPLSNYAWHHTHLKYWWYNTYYDEGEMIYVVYRLVDTLEDGQQYDPSDEFWVIFNAPVPGDFNADSYIDQSDLGHFEACATAPGISQDDPACQDADLDEDGDVDQSDFALFQRCISGSSQHVDPRCTE